jgi:hypothetical protein
MARECKPSEILLFLTLLSILHSNQCVGKTVLIHSAAGGCGMNAISICHQLGCHVVGTIGSEKKVKVLVLLMFLVLLARILGFEFGHMLTNVGLNGTLSVSLSGANNCTKGS